VLKKKIWANFQRIIELFTQKTVTKLSKVWVWNPGSEIREKPIPDPGSRGQKRLRIPDPDPQHWDPGIKKAPDPHTEVQVPFRNMPFIQYTVQGDLEKIWKICESGFLSLAGRVFFVSTKSSLCDISRSTIWPDLGWAARVSSGPPEADSWLDTSTSGVSNTVK
jgi:hypothetical protein